MKDVKVEKTRLLDTLKANKATHEADFEIAWEAFREKAIHNFEQRLVQLKDLTLGQKIDLYVNLPIPENHAEDYNRAIQMIEWEVGDQVILTEREFQQYVQDDWGWSASTKAAYVQLSGSESPSTVRKR